MKIEEVNVVAVTDNREEGIYTAIEKRREYTRTMEEDLEYDPYESVQCNSDTYEHGYEVMEEDGVESLEFSEQIYQSVWKYSNEESSLSGKKIIESGEAKFNPHALYAKVRGDRIYCY